MRSSTILAHTAAVLLTLSTAALAAPASIWIDAWNYPPGHNYKECVHDLWLHVCVAKSVSLKECVQKSTEICRLKPDLYSSNRRDDSATRRVEQAVDTDGPIDQVFAAVWPKEAPGKDFYECSRQLSKDCTRTPLIARFCLERVLEVCRDKSDTTSTGLPLHDHFSSLSAHVDQHRTLSADPEDPIVPASDIVRREDNGPGDPTMYGNGYGDILEETRPCTQAELQACRKPWIFSVPSSGCDSNRRCPVYSRTRSVARREVHSTLNMVPGCSATRTLVCKVAHVFQKGANCNCSNKAVPVNDDNSHGNKSKPMPGSSPPVNGTSLSSRESCHAKPEYRRCKSRISEFIGPPHKSACDLICLGIPVSSPPPEARAVDHPSPVRRRAEDNSHGNKTESMSSPTASSTAYSLDNRSCDKLGYMRCQTSKIAVSLEFPKDCAQRYCPKLAGIWAPPVARAVVHVGPLPSPSPTTQS